MDYLIVCTTALLVSGLTLFSGFGLGTILMPAFALFFPVPVAVAATALVHLANNIFKAALVGRYADWKVVLRFGLPAAAAALVGAALLNVFAALPPAAAYELAGRTHQVTILKLVIGVLIVVFAVFELVPQLRRLDLVRGRLVPGGALSGFFGGLSGHQGALRSAVLIKAGLTKEAFVGTGTIAAVMVDVSRLAVYGLSFYSLRLGGLDRDVAGLVVAATAAAFAGALAGRKLLPKMTFETIQALVGIMLVLVGLGLAAGLL
jgi:uncharacterized protein